MEIQEKEISELIKEAIRMHGDSHDSLIPILSEINRKLGFIPSEAIKVLKQHIHEPGSEMYVSESQLYSLASFYHMLSTKELGKHVIRFCESAPCHVMGGRELVKAIETSVGVKPGETSSDKKWTFVSTSCLGVCGVGPVMMVDDDIYGNVTPDQLPSIFAKYN